MRIFKNIYPEILQNQNLSLEKIKKGNALDIISISFEDSS